MSKLNFFIGLVIGAITGWLGERYAGRQGLEDQLATLRAERTIAQGQAKQMEYLAEQYSAEIETLKEKIKSNPSPDRIDDLRTISGIGPRASTALLDAGIKTFNQLAAMDAETIINTLKEGGLRINFDPTDWPEKAALALAQRNES